MRQPDVWMEWAAFLAAAIPALHFLWIILEHRGRQRVQLDASLQPVWTPDSRKGLRARVYNSGGMTVNTEWIEFETPTTRWAIPVDAAPPLERGRVEYLAISWLELLRHGIDPDQPVRVRVRADLGREFYSRWAAFVPAPRDGGKR